MTFGDTISNGIQDVSALLPLLGTEQCEQHVGTALEKGFLYASATPLSVFGTLGIVRTAFATLLATITYPFYGAIWLNDAGFSTLGSVSSMVIISRGTKQYGAEVNLERVMKEQNINDPELVSDIEWSGWGEKAESIPLSWNFRLILTSALSAVISMSPYIYLIHNHWNDPSSWIFLLLRTSGAFLSVVSVQLALQLRIHHITNSSLLLMKVKKRNSLPDGYAMKEQELVMEKRLSKLVKELDSKLKTSDTEKSLDVASVERDRNALAECQSFSWSSWSLLILQMLLAAGIFMTTAGYVGCFTLVDQSDAKNGPYIWLGMETALSLLRIFLWGSNPTWDDVKTGLAIQLELHDKGPSHFDTATPGTATVRSQLLEPSLLLITTTNQRRPEAFTDCTQNPLRSPTQSYNTLFPLITTPHHLSQLSCSLRDRPMGAWRPDQREGFIIESAGNFLATSTTYVGPLRHLQLENTSLFYSIVPYVNDAGEARKFLCTTALHTGSKASISIFTGGSKTPHAVYSSYCDELHATRALQVTLENDITNHPDSIDVLDTRSFGLIVEHSYNLFSRLLGGNTFPNPVELLWTVKFPSYTTTNYPETPVRLTKFDKQYIRLCQTYDLKGDCCSQRGSGIIRVFLDRPAGSLRYFLLAEYGVVMENVILEMYLCCIEHDLTLALRLPPAICRRIILEWIRKMQVRLAVERRQCEGRSSDLPTEVLETWDSLALDLSELRSPDSPIVLHRWKKLLITWLTTEDIPDVKELFELRPLSKLKHLKNALLPVFQTPIYHRMVTFLRPTLQLLHQLVQNDSNSPSLFDRIDVPGSADLSPPHASIIGKISKDGLSELAGQIHLIQTLQFRSISHSGLLAPLNVLDSNPLPLAALTTLNFRDIQDRIGGLDDSVVKLITSILTKNDNIICLGFNNCRHVDETTLDHLQETIQNNREKWVRRVTQGRTYPDKLEFLVGIQFSSGKEQSALHLTGRGAFSMHSNEDVFLTPVGEVFVLVSVPCRGKIVPIISLMLDDVDMFVTAKLQRFTGQASDNDISEVKVRAAVSSDGQRTLRLRLDGFPDVDEGSYELRIWVRQRSSLFRDVAMDFIPETGDKSVLTGMRN